MDLELKPSDVSVLEAAKKSNGGGIRLYPANKAIIDRLVKAGLLTPKRGNVTSVELYVITRNGRAALEEGQASDGVAEAMLRNVMDPLEPPWSDK